MTDQPKKKRKEKSLEELVKILDKRLLLKYDHYCQLHKEFDRYRGSVIEDTNIEKINALLKDIQDEFAELYPVYHWINYQSQPTSNIVSSYKSFIDNLKKACNHSYKNNENNEPEQIL